ncbi:MAG TPA: carbon-nitrogen hydrolase family protein, partial [bacterium]|nr:carbon-nitrogen hydrolase family protein [bacterium]
MPGRDSLSPRILCGGRQKQRYVLISGNGNADCVGGITTKVNLPLGKTYCLRVQFKMTRDVNPLLNLLYEISHGGVSQQIVEFHRLSDSRAVGEAMVVTSDGQGSVSAEIRLIYHLCAKGKIWIEKVSLTETDTMPPRKVRVACTGGPDSLEEYGLPTFQKALDAVGRKKVDLVLLPEYFHGEYVQEPLSGPSATLMSQKAKEYAMYVAGTIGLHDEAKDRVYNAALLYDRQGNLIGRYDKFHLYGPELHSDGITPGESVPVFQTHFGRVGFMTCYDSWFADVAELLALRGADIILFPSLGFDRALMHARSLDNCIYIV